MSIYSPNNRTPFLFVVVLLFVVILLIIPLRPSQWQKSDELAEQKDSLFQPTLLPQDNSIDVVVVLDSQQIITPATDSTLADTSIVVVPIETIDTAIVPPLVIEDTQPIISDPSSELAPASSEATTTDFSILGRLLGFLLFFGLIAFLIYKALSNRLQKKYWLQYNANLQPLGVPNTHIGGIEIDFSDFKEAPQPELINPADLEQSTQKEQPIEPVVKETIVLDEKIAEPVSDLPIEQEAEKEAEPEKTSPKQVVQEPTATITAKAALPFLERPLTKLLIEISTRSLQIAWATGRGLWKMISYFFVDAPPQPVAIDYKWQDAVSTLFLILFVACHWIIFPYSPSNIGLYLIMAVAVWILPSILRLHWGFGVFGVLAVLGELSALLIHAILAYSKNSAPGSGGNGLLYGMIGTSLAIVILVWAKLTNRLPKWTSILRWTLMSLAILFACYPYTTIGFEEVLDHYGLGHLLTRAIILYVVYEVLKVITTKLDASQLKVDTTIASTPTVAQQVTTQTEEQEQLTKLDSQLLSEEQLTELFSMPNWWKKTALHLLESIDMSNKSLNEDSEFVVLYLPDCVNLKHLHLYDNNFTAIPFEVTELEQLEVLSLSYNTITEVLPDIAYLTALKSLYLAHNKIQQLPKELGELTQLELLELRGNPLSTQEIERIKKQLPNTQILHDELDETINLDTDLIQKVWALLEEELKDPLAVTVIWNALDGHSLPNIPPTILRAFVNLKKLSLFQNNLTQIPPAVFELTQLEELNLSFNQIKVIPDAIGDLTKLQRLRISGLKLDYFSLNCKSLIALTYDNAGLTKFPDIVFNQPKLEELSLISNKIKVIPVKIKELKQLKSLTISHNNGLNPDIRLLANLPNLVHLNMNGLNWDSNKMLEGLELLTKLTELRLSYNSFSKIPAVVFGLTNLRVLSFVDCHLNEVSSLIGQMKNLFYLCLDENNLTTLPEEIKQLKGHLYTLSLLDNPISEETYKQLKKWLPETEIHVNSIDIEQITSKEGAANSDQITEPVEALEISDEELKEHPNLVNKVKKLLSKELKNPQQVSFSSALMQQDLTDLPISILKQFSTLSTLFLNSNKFTKIPTAVYYLPALKNLSLPSNKIEEITDDIGQLKNIEALDLSSNPIKIFSPKITELENLRHLKLSSLGLNAFPAFVLKMKTLQFLNLNNNHILRVPKEISQLQQLEELSLGFTGLSIIPASIFELKNLKTLNWVGNNLKVLPKELTQLQQLESLSIGHNTELQLSDALLAQFPRLFKLTLNGMELTDKSNFDYSKLPQLTSLWVSYNKFQEIPASIFKLDQIRSLSISHNQLKEIPDAITNLTKLEYLHLDHNQLTNLPASIKRLNNLRKIYLSDNNISIKNKRKIQRSLPNVEIEF